MEIRQGVERSHVGIEPRHPIVVEQEPHPHTACRRFAQRSQQKDTRRIVVPDIVLRIDGALRVLDQSQPARQRVFAIGKRQNACLARMRRLARLQQPAELRRRVGGARVLRFPVRDIGQWKDKPEDDNRQHNREGYGNQTEHNLLYTHEAPFPHEWSAHFIPTVGKQGKEGFHRQASRTGGTGPGLRSGRERSFVDFRLEPDQPPVSEIKHRALDHGRLFFHQANRLPGIHIGLVCFGKFSESGAGAVEKLLPADLLHPRLQPRALNADGPVIMKRIGNVMRLKPGPRLLHRVAVLDAVDHGGL